MPNNKLFTFKGRIINAINDSLDNIGKYPDVFKDTNVVLFYEENEDKTFSCNLISNDLSIDTYTIVNEFNVSKTIFTSPEHHDLCNFTIEDITLILS